MKKILLLSLLFTPLFSMAQDFDREKLDTYLNTLEEKNKARVAVAISKGDELVYESYNGVLSATSESRFNKDTKFKAGSISKTFTAVIIFQLIDEGKLTLETKLSEYYPDFLNADKITIGHLLNHQSGIHNFTDEPDFASYAATKKTKEELYEIINGMSSDFEPGSKSSYSNSAYILLGLIIEKVSGSTYQDNLENRIFEKLNLSNSEYGDVIETEKNEATSVIFQGSWTNYPLEWDMSIPYSAGAVVSTPRDLNTFMYALFQGDLTSEESLNQMKTINGDFGYGMFRVPYYNQWGYGHNGHIDSFDAASYYFKDADATVTVLTSGITVPFNDILVGTLSIYFGRPFEIPTYDEQAIELDTELLKNYEGDFASEQIPLDIVIKKNGDQLTAQATGQGAFPLTPFSETEFRYDAAQIVIEFGKNDDGIDYSTFVLKQGGQQFKFNKK